jgi:Uma2 family endonuclease
MHTLADWIAQPEEARMELIGGALVTKGAFSGAHGLAHGALCAALSGNSEWWVGPSVDFILDGNGFRADLVGWRREHLPRERLREHPAVVRPDWICEVVEDLNRDIDMVEKPQHLHRAGVPHYWILDVLHRRLTVHRHTAEGYAIVLRAEAHERVRAEPFEAIELHVGTLLGDDPPED